jgi:preprotein translocase subunit Sss1
MMPDQLARQEQIARRLEQSKRLLRDAKDPTTNERIGKLIGDLEHEQAEEKEK